MSVKRIAAYLRISVDTEKDRDNTSIENQRRIIKAYIKQTFPDAEVDYYDTSPKAYYSFLTKKSIELYNEVVPYIQNVLAYDIGWRVREAPSEIVLNSSELYESYCNLLKTYLGLIDEKYIIGSKVHKRIGYKTALVRLRDGTDLLSETHFNKEKEAIFYKNMSLLKLQGNHKLCFINSCRIKTNPETGKAVLIVEGLMARWVFNCCREDNVDFVIRAGKKKFKVERLCTKREFPITKPLI